MPRVNVQEDETTTWDLHSRGFRKKFGYPCHRRDLSKVVETWQGCEHTAWVGLSGSTTTTSAVALTRSVCKFDEGAPPRELRLKHVFHVHRLGPVLRPHLSMSFFKRHPQQDQDDNDDNDAPIDPDLRLRTVRTAASTIAESIRSELRAQRRSARKKRSLFFRKDKRPKTADSDATTSGPQIPGLRRNVYINTPLSAAEVDQHGQPLVRYARNKVRTSSKSILDPCSFSPHHFQDTPYSHFSQRTSSSNSIGMFSRSASTSH